MRWQEDMTLKSFFMHSLIKFFNWTEGTQTKGYLLLDTNIVSYTKKKDKE